MAPKLNRDFSKMNIKNELKTDKSVISTFRKEKNCSKDWKIKLFSVGWLSNPNTIFITGNKLIIEAPSNIPAIKEQISIKADLFGEKTSKEKIARSLFTLRFCTFMFQVNSSNATRVAY